VLQGNRKAVHKSEEPRDSDCTDYFYSIEDLIVSHTLFVSFFEVADQDL
jgi:hypothetical protein